MANSISVSEMVEAHVCKLTILNNTLAIIEGKYELVKEMCLDTKNHLEDLNTEVNILRGSVGEYTNLLDSSKVLINMLKDSELLMVHLENNIPQRYIIHLNDHEENLKTPTQKYKEVCNGLDENTPTVILKKKESGKTPDIVSYFSQDEFDNVPKYMRGNIGINKLNSFIDDFNKSVEKKYKILSRSRCQQKSNFTLYNALKRQECPATKGMYFIVEDDFKQFASCKMDKSCYSMLTMLRHGKRIRDVRDSGIVRYVVLSAPILPYQLVVQ